MTTNVKIYFLCIVESFMKKFDDYMEFFDQREDWKVDEDLRPEKCRDDGFFGRYGNFKQLEVD